MFPNCRRNFSGFEFVFLDQSVLNVTIKPCPDQSKRLCVHVPPLVQPLNALRTRG